VAATEGSRSEERGTKRSIYGALAANLLIAISKFVAGFASGSSAMLAEGVHSLADTLNQGFLLVGLRTSNRDPYEEHPFGHGQDQFFCSFLAAVLIFFAGGGFTIYQGIMSILGEPNLHRTAARKERGPILQYALSCRVGVFSETGAANTR
jgi:cation diffusion facilitator family transporter